MKMLEKNDLKKGEKPEANNKDKKVTTKKSDSPKRQEKDPNYRPAGADTTLGDGSAGTGGTSAI